MNAKKFLLAFVVVGVVLNILDMLVQGMLLANMYASVAIFRKDTPIAWWFVLDFIYALVLVFVYEKVKGSFAQGVAGGALFGAYAGLLVNFPMMLAMRLFFVDFPYSLGWIWTVYGIIWYVIAGVIIGLIYKPKA